jgi:Fic family protein
MGPAPRMASLFEWLARKREADEPPFVRAGVAHYGITDVHPFADGNGRVARLFQAAVLMEAGVLPGRMLSFERYYAEDRPAYYAALQSVRRNTLNMEEWLEYFLRGIVEEYERVAAAVEELSTIVHGGHRGALRLSEGQQRALTTLRIQGRREFARGEYEQAAGVGRTGAVRDLRSLVEHGLVTVRGRGRGTRYVLAGAASPRGRSRAGRPARWTDVRIERELRAFLDGRDTWPSPAEFDAAGLRSLYAAASRAGGIGRWRRIVGL